jgi:hypothetical protein
MFTSTHPESEQAAKFDAFNAQNHLIQVFGDQESNLQRYGLRKGLNEIVGHLAHNSGQEYRQQLLEIISHQLSTSENDD